MGTINYRTSEYITLGYKPEYPSDFADDKEFMEQMREEAEAVEMDVDDYIRDWIYMNEEDMYNNVLFALKGGREFYYFKVEVEPGYYDGFSVQISRDTPLYMEPWEKDDAYGEIKELEKFLILCANQGMVECYPGWGTGYEDYGKTVADITEAMAQARKDIDDAPVWDDTRQEVILNDMD